MISKARLKRFWETPGRKDAEGPLRAWYKHVNSASTSWASWSDLRSDFSAASIVGNCIVFNIAGNKYRLVTRVLYRSWKVFILKVMTHAEYDHDTWKDECGCFAPPPTRTAKTSPKRKER